MVVMYVFVLVISYGMVLYLFYMFDFFVISFDG